MDELYNADGEYGKRGYLKENFRVFNIKDKCNSLFEFHYHDFDKIVFFMSGEVTYVIEGREYQLEPNDILLVRHNDIHRPVINPEVEYDRIIVWIDNNYLNNYGLSKCFNISNQKQFSLLRLTDSDRKKVFDLLNQITECTGEKFADDLMSNSLFFQMMILINRVLIENLSSQKVSYKSDKQIDKIIEYINQNLYTDLSINKISNEFFISRYHLMHKFKTVTGKTIFSYIQTKRLLNAASLLDEGKSPSAACYESGYNDYSVFLKAFKKEFGETPKEYIKKRAQE